MTEKEAMLWMYGLENMWDEKIRKTLDFFGNALEFYHAGEKALKSCGIWKEEKADYILDAKRKFSAEKEMELLEKKQIVFLTWEDKEFPEKLKQIQNAPAALFAKGDLQILKEKNPAAAIIGARVCTPYGSFTAQKFAGELGSLGVVVLSGMARGTDSAAHQGALEAGGKTVAVLGCGVDVCYPPENRYLYDEIIKKGLVLSEYYPGTKPLSWHFPKRNRIISGLADCIVITEAREKSGTLITASHALEQGREVCAVPGRINDPLSLGCNRLIRDGAVPVMDVSDILFCMGLNYKIFKKDKKFLEKENEVVYSVLGLHPLSMEEIMQKTGLESGKLYRILLDLQLSGLVEEPVKNYYIRKNS